MKCLTTPPACGLLAVGLCAALAACGSGSGPDAALPDPGREQALAVAQPGELVRVVQDKLRARQAQWKLTPTATLDGAPASVAMPTTTAGATAATPVQSGPLVQEDGVEEADRLQTDGTYFYSLSPTPAGAQQLQVHARGADGSAVALATLALPAGTAMDVYNGGIQLSPDGRALAVVGQTWVPVTAAELCPAAGCTGTPAPGMQASRVDIQRVDVSTPGGPALGERLTIDGSLVDSRRIGDALYIVTTHRPWLQAEAMPAGASATQREAVIASMTAADLLPRLRRNGGAPQPLLADTDCYVQGANASLAVEFTTITVLDLRSPVLARTSRCFIGGTEALYMTPSSLYLATTRYGYQVQATIWPYPADIKTDLHKFALAAGTVQYRGSGQVDGHLGWDPQRKPYRLSEHNGDLRVLSFTGTLGWPMTAQDAGTSTLPPSPAQLTVLRERAADQTLQTVATLPNSRRPAALGKPGEQIYGVRFAGARGYVVTFRRMDPLYVLDLADPADPRLAGELELAGFSESLFPLPNGLLLGVGRDANAQGRVTGLKLALFDVADPAKPAVLGASSFGGAASQTALDSNRHGLNLLLKDGVARIALPANLAPDRPDPWAGVWQHGLQRFEVDTQARTLAARPARGEGSGDSMYPVGLERSVQVGDRIYHLRGDGSLASYDW